MRPEEMFEAYLEDLNHGSELRKEITTKNTHFKLVMFEVQNYEKIQVRRCFFSVDEISAAVSVMGSWEKECKEDKTRDYVISLDYVSLKHDLDEKENGTVIVNREPEIINIGEIRVSKGVNK